MQKGKLRKRLSWLGMVNWQCVNVVQKTYILQRDVPKLFVKQDYAAPNNTKSSFPQKDTYPSWKSNCFNHSWDPKVIETENTSLCFLQPNQEPSPLLPRKLLHHADSGRLLVHSAEAIRREPLSRHRVHHLQLRATRQPRQATSACTGKETWLNKSPAEEPQRQQGRCHCAFPSNATKGGRPSYLLLDNYFKSPIATLNQYIFKLITPCFCICTWHSCTQECWLFGIKTTIDWSLVCTPYLPWFC